jgi:GNAT superfamily N-acetyltransferase
MMVRYTHTIEGISPEHLQGFFEGWPNPPSPEAHLRLLWNSDEVGLAIDDEAGLVVGFITAITDHVLSAYIPLLEVLPAYRHQGIGTEFVRRMLSRLSGLYMIDLLCDSELQPFYATFGMQPATGMTVRNYAYQSGQGVSTKLDFGRDSVA